MTTVIYSSQNGIHPPTVGKLVLAHGFMTVVQQYDPNDPPTQHALHLTDAPVNKLSQLQPPAGGAIVLVQLGQDKDGPMCSATSPDLEGLAATARNMGQLFMTVCEHAERRAQDTGYEFHVNQLIWVLWEGGAA